MTKSQTIDNIVDVTRKNMRTGPASSTIQRRAQVVLNKLECRECELSVVLCDDTFIHTLNKKYRNKDKATDVLSFPMNNHPSHTRRQQVLGDVIISIDTARRQAQVHGQPLLLEVTTLLIHGILHLLGHTHENDNDEKEMNTLAEALLQSF